MAEIAPVVGFVGFSRRLGESQHRPLMPPVLATHETLGYACPHMRLKGNAPKVRISGALVEEPEGELALV